MDKAGQPTKYNKEILVKSEEYIKQCVDEFKSMVESKDEKTGKKKYISRFKVNLPKAEGLALYLEVHRDTLYEWARKHKEFSYILERINQLQADRVINEAMAGNYNSLIAKLLLGKHGYKEKTDITSDDQKITGFNFVRANDSDNKTD